MTERRAEQRVALGDNPSPPRGRFLPRMRRDVVTLSVSVGVATALLLGFAFLVVDPAPPKKIVIAAGLDGSVYQHFAEQYKNLLARQHVDLEIRPSAGSMQNLHDLSAGVEDADVAFIQSGTSNDNVASRRQLVSLGSLFVEPVWLFYRQSALAKVGAAAPDDRTAIATRPTSARRGGSSRATASISRLDQLRGLKVNVGTMGSDGPRLARQLLEINGLDNGDLTLTDFDDTTAASMLVAGSVDAAMFVTAPESPLIQDLLRAPGIKLANFDEAEAYSRRFSFLKHVVLPKGIVSFARRIPDEDVHLIAPTATLIAKDTLHPAAIELLMQSVAQVHGGPSWFGRPGEFPNDQYTEVQVSAVAQRYYRSGPLFLQRYLPFWLANFIERMGLLIVPFIALLIPLSKVLPPLYAWRIRSRIYRWYGELREVEEALARAAANPSLVSIQGPTGLETCLDRLASIKAKVDELDVPLAFVEELYTLKMHVERVRAGLAGAP